MNISEKRLPQDGRINFKADGIALDIRVSTVPTIYAESISLRLLNQKKAGLHHGPARHERRGAAARSSTCSTTRTASFSSPGPTGSGKSTSLNAFLRKINSTDLRIITIEDPIEYEAPGRQPDAGAAGDRARPSPTRLRHVLRQDPDVIMVGEIRDQETAEIAIRASLTGHLVFSTLHTNDAPGAITRLVDMGIEPFLVASAIELVIAQRLVRRRARRARPEPIAKVKLVENLAILGCNAAEAELVAELKRPVGCDRCRGTGYRGRVGIFEIFRLNEEMHAAGAQAREHAHPRRLRPPARHADPRPERLGKVKTGLTTFDEVLRVVTVTDA
jgi:type II secretory ATPase GspE/PulE/Tfp pilus assembly ATPase PilB-like protein